jgi:hypothetical protein
MVYFRVFCLVSKVGENQQEQETRRSRDLWVANTQAKEGKVRVTTQRNVFLTHDVIDVIFNKGEAEERIQRRRGPNAQS